MFAPRELDPKPQPAAVLFVDDDENIRKAFNRAMRFGRIPVTVTSGPEEALALLDEQPASFSVLVADYWMPGMDGVELLGKAATVAPWTTRILISGQLELPNVIRAVNSGSIHHVLAKPWDAGQIVPVVKQALERATVERKKAKLLSELENTNHKLLEMNQELDTLVNARTSNILDGLASALSLRDTETQWHSRRVSLYARRLGAELGVTGAELTDIEYGALLHDVGKIGIPDSILRKPGPLTDEEWTIMRMHARLGYDLLSNIDFLKGASLVPLHHHEKFDGTGYPQKLRGEDINIGARIFSVVDTLDAITTNRPYRRARDFGWAREEIKRCNGSQFDPAVVEAYMNITDDEWHSIQTTHVGAEER